MGIVARGGQEYIRQQLAGEGVNPRPPYATGVVHHDAVMGDGTVVHHRQVFDSGHLTEWTLADEPGPWALVRHGDPFQPFALELAGPDRAASVKIRVGQPGAQEALSLPPLDDMASDRWGELPEIPDATAWLRFELLGSPVGPLACDIRYVDGSRVLCELVDEWAEPVEGEPAWGAPQMHIAMTWRNYLRMRSGELTALEAIEDGGIVDARWTLLLMLHGLLQEREYAAVYRSLPRIPAELGWWGEVAPWVPERDSF